MNYYTVYRNKDDAVVATGTSRECMKKLNCASLNTFHSLVSHCRHGVNKKYTVVSEPYKNECQTSTMDWEAKDDE